MKNNIKQFIPFCQLLHQFFKHLTIHYFKLHINIIHTQSERTVTEPKAASSPTPASTSTLATAAASKIENELKLSSKWHEIISNEMCSFTLFSAGWTQKIWCRNGIVRQHCRRSCLPVGESSSAWCVHATKRGWKKRTRTNEWLHYVVSVDANRAKGQTIFGEIIMVFMLNV